MSPDKVAYLDRLICETIETSKKAMELTQENSLQLAMLLEFSSSVRENLKNLNEQHAEDTQRGIDCRKDVEGMVASLRKEMGELRARLNYVLGGIAISGGVISIFIVSFIQHITK